MKYRVNGRAWALGVAIAAGAGAGGGAILMGGCRAQGDVQEGAPPAGDGEVKHAPGSLAYDRSMWQQLLRDHASIRRVVRHTESGVEAVTESEDPEVAARIRDHAHAMQERMKNGAQVRVWDEVFREMFEAHGKILIEVTDLPKGVMIKETSEDPGALALLRSHAMGVSAFVREGSAAAQGQTRRFRAGDALPAPELAIGGVPHRFLLTQPDAGQVNGLRGDGVDVIVNFRKPVEHEGYDEAGVVNAAGAAYCNIPYKGAAELTDSVIDATREAIKAADERGETAALHCRTGNRIGPGWAAYRVLDQKIPLEQAVSEARAMQMTDVEMEKRVREYIAARGG
ncbi:MAG TPA: hypothetical protein VK176_16285 [Phycisphaerales bacterium]|nr:hypothetical protein [Phycisphaerales bacterium]